MASMANDDAQGIPGLKSLNRLFAMALWDVKMRTATLAESKIRQTRAGNEKYAVFSENFVRWREDSVSVIKQHFPQYVELGLKYNGLLQSAIPEWAEDQAWEILRGQCGVKRFGEPQVSRHVSTSVRWWLAVASEGNFEANVPDSGWYPPKWFASNEAAAFKSLRDLSYGLSLRFHGALDEELERARLRLALHEPDPLQRATGRAPDRYPEAGAAKASKGFNHGHPRPSKGLSAQGGLITDSFSWKELEQRFRDLQAQMGRNGLGAWRTTTRWEDGTTEVNWTLQGSKEYESHLSFQILATIGAQKLGFNRTERTHECWLNTLLEWVNTEGSLGERFTGQTTNSGRTGKTSTLELDRVAEHSAIYCCELISRHSSEQPEQGDMEHADPVFQPSDDYTEIGCGERKYCLTKSAGAIVKELHTAQKEGKRSLSGPTIRRKLRCGKVWDQFRRRDGPAFFSRYIRKTGQDMYSLEICDFSGDEPSSSGCRPS